MALKAGGDAEVESVVVTEPARRVGIGRTLCIAVLDWCREQGASAVGLEVRAKSEGAIALYSGLGFQQVGRRPNYYREPEDDALIFILRLAFTAESD
jgi:ribosomal protein S18 acetylase RimI-like enzyme